MKGRTNPAAGILELELSPEEKLEIMLEAAAVISDNLIEIKDRDFNTPVCVASLELLIFALREFAAHAEQDKLAMDSRHAVLLDSTWSMFNLFYVKYLQHVTHQPTLEAAHILHALLADYVIEAHQIMFEVNKHNFKEKRLFDKHLEMTDADAGRYLDILTIKLAELHQAYLTQYPENAESLRTICKAEKSALHAARVILGYYLEHHEFDLLNGKGERIAQIENIYHLYKDLYITRFLDTPFEMQAMSLLKILEIYLQEATVEFNLIMSSLKPQALSETEEDELSSSDEEHPYYQLLDESSDEPQVKLIQDDGEFSDEEQIPFNPNTAIWVEASPLNQHHDIETTRLLDDVSDDEISPAASPMPTRKTLERNACLMFQPQPRHVTLPIQLPDPNADELYGSDGIFKL